MIIHATTRDEFFSSLIRDVLSEPASHLVIELDCGMILHSNVKGTHATSRGRFLKTNRIVTSVKPKKAVQDFLVVSKFSNFEGRGYDYFALIYTGCVYLLRKYLSCPIPKVNLWQDSGMDMCTEFVQKIISRETDSMITPSKYLAKLVSSGDWENIDA